MLLLSGDKIRTKHELYFFDRMLKHVEHSLEALHAYDTATSWTEMLRDVRCTTVAPCEGEVNEALFLARTPGTRESGDADRNIRVTSTKRAFSHCARHDFRNRIILFEEGREDSEKIRLCFL